MYSFCSGSVISKLQNHARASKDQPNSLGFLFCPLLCCYFFNGLYLMNLIYNIGICPSATLTGLESTDTPAYKTLRTCFKVLQKLSDFFRNAMLNKSI